MKRTTILLLMFLLISLTINAQEKITLQYCRETALQSNKDIKIAQEKQIQAEEMKKMALDQFFPKISANAVALWSEKEISILNNDQKDNLNNLGSNISKNIVQRLGNGPIANYLANTSIAKNIEGKINGFGEDIVDDFRTDTRGIYAGMISVTQPIYMGGKIRALYKIASAKAEIENLTYDKESAELLIKVDEYYWRVVSVGNKYRLAQEYYKLLDTLSRNVKEMVNEGVATQSDMLNVQVKLNEAQMSLTKAENGLILSKMALAQLCGFSLTSDFEVEDSDLQNDVVMQNVNVDMNKVYQQRSEMQMLAQAQKMAEASVKMARSTLLPNLVANGGYLISNPNLLNGFDRSFNGMFYGGLALNIPIAHPSSFHALKLAKSKRREVSYQVTEAQEKIKLQVTQIQQQKIEAERRYWQAESSIENAEENLRLAQESFNEGVVSATDLMGAQTAWIKAYSEKIDAVIDLKLCNLYLNQALGGK